MNSSRFILTLVRRKDFKNVKITPRPLLEFFDNIFTMVATSAQYVTYACDSMGPSNGPSVTTLALLSLFVKSSFSFLSFLGFVLVTHVRIGSVRNRP